MRDRERFTGLSSDELLRRARTLRDIATSNPLERKRLERLAFDHEEAARLLRSEENGDE
jgi:hypothetical protein